MAQLGREFDAESVEPQGDFSPLSTGWYLVEIIDSDYVETASGTGAYVEVTYEVIGDEYDGKYVGRQYWDRFNLENENSQAVEIGERQFSAFLHAIKKMKVQDTDELLEADVPQLEIKVKVKSPSKKEIAAGYDEPKNQTVAWRAIESPAGGQRYEVDESSEEPETNADEGEEPAQKPKPKPKPKPAAKNKSKSAGSKKMPWQN